MEKKTTKKTARKKTAKRKRSTKKAADNAAAPEAPAESEKAPAAAKKKKKSSRKTAQSAATETKTKKATRSRGKRSKRGAAPVKETAAAAAAAPAADLAEPTRHEGEDGSIIIRFPPVAPSPFDAQDRDAVAEPLPEAEPDVAEALDEAAELRAVDDFDDLDDAALPDDPPVDDDFEEVEEVEAAAAPADDDEPESPSATDETTSATADDADRDDEDGRRLTRSQKRRLRRKRRAASQRDDDPSAEDQDVAADAEPSTAASVADAAEVEVDDSAELAAEIVARSDDEDEVISTTDEEEDEEAQAAKSSPRRRRSRRRRRKDDGEDVDAAAQAAEKAAGEVDYDDADEETAAPSGDRQMVINFVPRDECRIAILESGKLEEIYLERASYENHVGSIYKGVVTNVEPSIQAAFVDFGLGKNGFLHITDLHPDYMSGGNHVENVGRKMPRRSRPPIQKCLRRGQEVIVQITKEGIGTKGPTLSTYLSIPGRFLVMMPGMRRLGISRKIEDEEVRQELRDKLKELKLPDDIGFIARTAAEGRSVKEIQNDLNYLERLWRAVERRMKKEKAPTELYRESDLVVRTIRDVFTADIGKIIVDDPEVARRAQEFLSIFSPKSSDIVQQYEGPEPIFHKFKIEEELERLHSRRVPLASGGSLVIDATEALVAIDVNSGRFRTEDDAESTAFKLNMEAAEEIARQLRLRDLGGVVVCDFIDMRQEKHKRQVERALISALKAHKERAKVLRMSQFGLIELTRQRQRASLTRNVYQDCPHCRGGGLVKTSESVLIDVGRAVQYAATREHVHQIEVTLNPEIANQLQNRKRGMLYELEQTHRRAVNIKPDPTFSQDQVQVQCYDQRGRPVPHA